MRIRYAKDEQGNQKEIAHLYLKDEHNINNTFIDSDALNVVRRLQQQGFEAYVVGGAVRDIMLGRSPKDFDIATSASPRQVHRLFRNARVIGKRFKLVHLLYKEGKIIEVSTFRSLETAVTESNNIYGRVEEDAKRRDFSINSFYYDPKESILLDFNNSFKDFQKKVIVSVLPLKDTFIEDPVRMIRLIKYSCTTEFKISYKLRRQLKKDYKEIQRISISRLTDEMSKIINTGCAQSIFNKLNNYKLLQYIIPKLSLKINDVELQESLEKLDSRKKNNDVNIFDALYYLTKPFILVDKSLPNDELFADCVRQTKEFIYPLTPSNYDVEVSVSRVLSDHGYNVKKFVKPTKAMRNKAKREELRTRKHQHKNKKRRKSHKS